MPTVQDEEESLCLLAADLQDLPNPKESPNANTNWTTNDDEDEEQWNEKTAFLTQGSAEKAFYNVCKTNDDQDEEEEEDELDEADHVQVVSGILGSLEAEHSKENACSVRNSRSLVVDIHLPPASEDDEDVSSSCNISEAAAAALAPAVASSNIPTARPCKHEVNRFQRCYSDGSQASPKRKAAANKAKDQLRHSHFGENIGLDDAYSMREENLDRIETVICDNEQLSTLRTGTKAKRPLVQASNFRGSTVSEGSSSVSLFRGAAFGIHQEFMQFKNSLLEGTTKASGCSEPKQKRKSDTEMYASDSPSPLVKFDLNDHEVDSELEGEDHVDLAFELPLKDEAKMEVTIVKKPHKFIYPRLNFFGGSSNVVGDSCSQNQTSQQQLHKMECSYSKNSDVSGEKKSPYTFFSMDSDDDFDPYGSDVQSDADTKRDLLISHSLENQNIDIDNGSCLSASSSTVSMPVCRICQLPGMEPSNPLISPCRCLGSIRYVHNNCLLKWLEVSSRRRSGPPCCELCQYQYLRHKKFVISHWRFPECSLRDKFLHFFFIVNVCLMIACAAVTIICFKEVEPEHIPYRNANTYRPGELTLPELITVSCGILFFLAFFLAIYVEVKAKHTVYQLICKFFYMNHEWSVEEYDRKRDLAESRKLKEKETKKHKLRNNRRHHRRESNGSSSHHTTSAS